MKAYTYSLKSAFAVTIVLVACIAASGEAFAQTARTNPRNGVEYYLQTYGRVPASEVQDVYTVFEKVRSTADKSSLVNPQLIVVGDMKQASAFALSDGTIFLSKKALSIVRESATAEQTKARLAFVLGHELAHLANNDFWDNQISQALLESATAKEVGGHGFDSIVDTSLGQQKKELKADDLGFVYAALAGYDVDGLLQPTGSNDDFLSFWNAKAGKRNDPNYPQATQRAALLRLRLNEMRDALQNFEFGSRLMHFGRYREAIARLREFQKQFPGRELFNNLGYCHLRLAIAQIDPQYAQHYWLPMVSDLDSPLVKLTTRSAEGVTDRRAVRLSASAREGLLQAARYFESAIERDANYAPSYVNLAVAQLLLGMDGGDARLRAIDSNHLLHAKIAVESAVRLQPDHQQTAVLAMIVEYELQQTDKSRRSLPGGLGASIETNDPYLLYNLTVLNEASDRGARYRQRLIAQLDTLPRKLQALVCRQMRPTPAEQKGACDSLSSAPVERKAPWSAPLRLSRDLLEEPLTDGELRQNGWQRKTLSSGAAFVGAGSDVLALDDIVSLDVLKRVSATAATLTQCCSQPYEKIPVANGTLWHYGRWIALVRENSVDEVWLSN